MSLDAWKAVFYKKSAAAVPVEKAIKHSIKKWKGLRPEILKAHEIDVIDGNTLVDQEGEEFGVDAGTCALCHHFDEDDCMECPLFLARGHRNCSVDGINDPAPYAAWIEDQDPEPMIKWLKRCHF